MIQGANHISVFTQVASGSITSLGRRNMIKKRDSVKLILLNPNKEVLMIYSKDSAIGKDGSGKKASFGI